MDDCDMEALGRRLELQGHTAAAARRVVARYSVRTYRKHQLAWCRVWRPYCVEHNLDPWAYNMHAAADCLSRVQERSKEYAAANGTKEQHSSFKEARAAITAFWRLVHPHTNLAEEPAIKDMAVGLRRTAPLLRRYDDTWDIAAIFIMMRSL